MKQFIKKIIPIGLISQYHKTLAVSGKMIYRNPSEKMIVIGVTGTNGKSTTCILIGKILEEAGHKVGVTTTALFKVAEKEWLNNKKMTMLGRMELQKLLKQMVDLECGYAVIETSSEGIKQHRHLSINYDIALFTNLTPEHIESHGGFDNYKMAKQKLFAKLETEPKKIINGQNVPKVIIANTDDENSIDFTKFWADEKYSFGLEGKSKNSNLKAKNEAINIKFNSDGVSFRVYDVEFDLRLFGEFNIYNSLAAISVALSQGISLEICKEALEKIDNIPGRMEFIDNERGFKILIDYAPEPESLKQLYQTIKQHQINQHKIIHVLGSCGGGRDVSRRPILGKMAGEYADYVIVTNEDPYNDDPMDIIDQVVEGAIKVGKKLDQDLFKVLDRREAIQKALDLAKNGDLVLLTGKGCEQAICVANGKKIAWDEREVVRELLKK